MRLLKAIACIATLLALSACTHRSGGAPADSAAVRQNGSLGRAQEDEAPATQSIARAEPMPGSRAGEGAAKMQAVSLAQADGSQAAQAAVERKLIRDAELTLELDSPAEGQRKLASIAEANGGFVVNSESQQDNAAPQPAIVSVQMRVPAARFDAVISEIRAVGTHIRAEKILTKDVTEEFIDLEARLRSQRALEAQFMEIMKRAGKVSDALEVHRELGTVRTEIERIEGRRRFLENQAALSTIRVTLVPPAPLVSANTSGFLSGIREAFGDGVDISAAIMLGIIRFGIALVPVVLFIFLPLLLVWRFLVRPRFQRRPASGANAPPAVADTAT